LAVSLAKSDKKIYILKYLTIDKYVHRVYISTTDVVLACSARLGWRAKKRNSER